MALVTIQRSPSVCSSPQSTDSGAGGSQDEEDAAKNGRSLSECYFAGKGAAVVLPPVERAPPPERRLNAPGSDIQHHLQSMFYLLRQEETLKMAVKLESVHWCRTRYLVVVSCPGRCHTEESCLLGIDCNETTTVGLVLRVLADTTITLDGDGGFSVSVCGRQHIFKPVSVQAMWSALQTLHKVSSKAREHNYFLGGVTHDWVSYYEQRIHSDRSCLNEWHAMDSLESRRPPSPDSLRNKPREREETERVIRSALKEIMMVVDLDEVTSKQVRARLEEALDMDLVEFKPFIDQEMLVILGQMDAATEIFPHVYLGSEWNASNLEELNKNGVCHILNVTREIDNFFPGMFNYLNVRVYDDDKTDLLKHWDNTFKYITKAKQEGSKVLVHCKMGVSRSASVVIAYAMKAYNWDFKKALEYVQNKRNCIKPNTSFILQLETYQGILDAMKNREKLQRSKSETNLKGGSEVGLCVGVGARSVSVGEGHVCNERLQDTVLSPPPRCLNGRPKSWSPDHDTADSIFPSQQTAVATSASLERLSSEGGELRAGEEEERESQPPPTPPPLPPPPLEARNYNLNVRMPCGNGLAYSVSQNKILHLPSSQTPESGCGTVRHRVSALESVVSGGVGGGVWRGGMRGDRRGLVLNLTSQFEELPPPPVASKVALPPTQQAPPPVRDPFSSQLDRVFDREERRQCEVSRQSSWSSYDSAVVLGDCVSRQSSWGSGDTRCCTLPSRNSSWGSYDMRPTMHNLPERDEVARRSISVDESRLSPDADTKSVHGIVKNLKKEYEAKSAVINGGGGCTVLVLKGGFSPEQVAPAAMRESLPSSPISEQASPAISVEDLSVRRLVGRYECPPPQGPPPPPPHLRPLYIKHSVQSNNLRNSCRPPLMPPVVVKATIPPSPSVVVASVVAKAATRKQQQGKTHPLARLAFNKQRSQYPVYNTM